MKQYKILLASLLFLNLCASIELVIAGSWHGIDEGDFVELSKLVSPTIEHLKEANIDVLSSFHKKNIGRQAILKCVYQLVSENHELSERLKSIDFQGRYSWPSLTIFATDPGLRDVRTLLGEYHYYSAGLFDKFWDGQKISIESNKSEAIREVVEGVGQLVLSLQLGWHEYCRRLVHFTLQFDMPNDRIKKILVLDQAPSAIFKPGFRVQDNGRIISQAKNKSEEKINSQFTQWVQEHKSLGESEKMDFTIDALKQYLFDQARLLWDAESLSEIQCRHLIRCYGALYFLTFPHYLKEVEPLTGVSFGQIITMLWVQSGQEDGAGQVKKSSIVTILDGFFRAHNRATNDYFGFDGHKHFRTLMVSELFQ